MTRNKVAESLNISIRQEKPVPGMARMVMSEVGGPLLELVDLIASRLVETGRILLNGGYLNLGTFVHEALTEAKCAADKFGASPLSPEGVVLENEPFNMVVIVLGRMLQLSQLMKAFPAFQDMCLVIGARMPPLHKPQSRKII